jgi:hypothetical protein
MGARAQLAWMVKGRSATIAGLESLAVDLRELQQKVAGLETILYDLRRDHLRLGERQLDEFDSVRAAVAAATDDLVARVEAVDARVRASS